MARRLAGLDRAAVRRVAETESPLLDHVMPWLSLLASHSVLWIALAGCLEVAGSPRARRAGRRGLGSVAAASAAANLIGKGLASRTRPATEVPPARRLPHPPWTSSFPSGHAASAAAFATGVALEMPAAAVPAGVLAAAVGASRVVTGVHYPSDVLGGFAIGVAAAAATLWLRPRQARAEDATARLPRRRSRPWHAAACGRSS